MGKKDVSTDGNKDTIKHSATIHMAGELSLLERKTFNVLLAWAFNSLQDQETHKIPIRELIRFLRFNSNDHELLKKSLRNLSTTHVQWNYLEKDEEVWESSTLLSAVRIINGVCIYGYSFVMRDRMSDPKMYAKLNLIQQSLFNKKHAHILWEIFKDYFDEKNGRGETPWIKIDQFKSLLGLKETEYTSFKILNRDVIKKAIKEINDISDLYIDLKNNIKKRKEGRKIAALKFIIKRNPKNIITPQLIEEITRKDQSKLPLAEFEIENQQLLQTLLSEFGISNNKAVELLKTKDEFYIEEVLESVREQIKAGKVKNVPAFTVRAIEQDYRKQKTKFQLDKEKKQDRKKQSQKQKELLEKLKADFDHQYKAKVDSFLNELAPDQKENLIRDFEKEKITNSNNVIQNLYRKRGLDSPGNQTLFRSFVAQKMLPAEEIDFALFARNQGYEVTKQENGDYKINVRKPVEP